MIEHALPPGQHRLNGSPPRFGLDAFLQRAIEVPADWRLTIRGNVEAPLDLGLEELVGTRVQRTLDLHCVTTWTATGLGWSGASFADVWQRLIVPRARPHPAVTHLLAVALDGYRAAIPLDEVLKDDVLLADRLDDRPLDRNHGAPLRLVVPQLYGYKSVKHLARLELCIGEPRIPVARALVHPRGRVDIEERSSTGVPWLWRGLYRTLVPVFLRRARRHQL